MRSKPEGALGAPAVPALGRVLEFMRVVWALDQRAADDLEARSSRRW
jgi:hypothetical protein